jgi:hypothetical protein
MRIKQNWRNYTAVVEPKIKIGHTSAPNSFEGPQLFEFENEGWSGRQNLNLLDE